MAAGTFSYSKPARWRETISMAIATGTGLDTYTPVFPRSYEYARNYWPQATVERAQPLFYADYDFDHWYISPTPDQNYPVETLYWQLPPMLDDSTQTNWLTDQAPDLLLYATLLDCAPFLKNEEMTATWQAFYDRHLAGTNGEDMQRIFDRSQKRTSS